jgi:hypothetical protein
MVDDEAISIEQPDMRTSGWGRVVRRDTARRVPCFDYASTSVLDSCRGDWQSPHAYANHASPSLLPLSATSNLIAAATG